MQLGFKTKSKKVDVTIVDHYIERRIIEILTKLGMPSNILGHRYLKEAIRLSVINSTIDREEHMRIFRNIWRSILVR